MMATAEMFADIVKWTENADGSLSVVGRATGPDLDHDQQICDPSWLSTAMPKWMSTGGNIREQHSAIAAGVATDLEKTSDDGWMVTADVVDPVSATKVKRGVLKGFSIGIKNARVVKDQSARGGRIVGGDIVETSLVDRPCNPTCKLTIAKAAVPGVTGIELDADKMLVRVEEFVELEKRKYTAEQRRQMAKDGHALPDGSFPIKDADDLGNAAHLYGQADNPTAAKAHIKKRARALGLPDPTSKKGQAKQLYADLVKGTGRADTHNVAVIKQTRDSIVELLKQELDEMCAGEDEMWDVADLMMSLSTVMRWWQHEADNGEVVGPFPKEMQMGDTPEVTKVDGVPAAPAPAPAETIPPAETTTKAETPDVGKLVDEAVSKALEASGERVKALETEIAALKALPQSGGPVLTRTAEQKAKADAVEARDAQIAKYTSLAKSVSDPALAIAYREEVEKLKGI